MWAHSGLTAGWGRGEACWCISADGVVIWTLIGLQGFFSESHAFLFCSPQMPLGRMCSQLSALELVVKEIRLSAPMGARQPCSILDPCLQPQVALQAGTVGLVRYVMTSLSIHALVSLGALPTRYQPQPFPRGGRCFCKFFLTVSIDVKTWAIATVRP